MTLPIRVMLVDDSAVVRGVISRILSREENIEIVASVSNGAQAIAGIERYAPDVMTLDVEMPVMDGITALPQLLKASPHTKIIMCSTLTERNGQIAMKALELGATETIAKPTSANELLHGENFEEQIVRLVRSLGRIAQKENNKGASLSQQAAAARSSEQKPLQKKSWSLNTNPGAYKGKPALIAIGSSTGGPQALFHVLSHFRGFDVPVIVTQHMPATFTAILAQHISKKAGIEAFEGAEGMVLEKGKVYVAPGGFHMLLKKQGTDTVITLGDGPQENFVKPSVDPMLRSAIGIYGNKVLGVMLTGMGADGLPSFRDLVKAGGRVIAQDEKTSVVWGMPGAVAEDSLCSAVLPLDEIGPWVKQRMML